MEFTGPCLDISMTSYSELPKLLKQSTSAVGSFIAIGKAFVERGSIEMDSVILPKLRDMLHSAVIPRVLPSYAILFWFTMEVRILCCCNA